MNTSCASRRSILRWLPVRRPTVGSQVVLFYADESGSEIVEWTVLALLIIVATYVVMGQLRIKLAEVFRSLIERQF